MKTTVEMVIQFFEAFSNMKLTDKEREHYLMHEKIEHQKAYNAGFIYAKRLYEKNDDKPTNFFD